MLAMTHRYSSQIQSTSTRFKWSKLCNMKIKLSQLSGTLTSLFFLAHQQTKQLASGTLSTVRIQTNSEDDIQISVNNHDIDIRHSFDSGLGTFVLTDLV